MGRRRSANAHLHLPKLVYPVKRADGSYRYYYGRERIPLGKTYPEMLRRLSELESSGGTIETELAVFEREYLPTLKPGTARGYRSSIGRLTAVFGQATFRQIGAAEMKRYVKLHGHTPQAVRDIACLSSMWSWAIGEGRTSVPNPRMTIEFKRIGHKGQPATDRELEAVYAQADRVMRDLYDLLYLTGQDVRVVLSWRREHLIDGCIDTRRSKTDWPIRIEIEGELDAVIRRCLSGPVKSMFIVADDKGQQLSYMRAWNRHRANCVAAGVSFEMRAIRRKTGRDSPSLEAAQELLGHADTATTRNHYRTGERVKPLNRKIR